MNYEQRKSRIDNALDDIVACAEQPGILLYVIRELTENLVESGKLSPGDAFAGVTAGYERVKDAMMAGFDQQAKEFHERSSFFDLISGLEEALAREVVQEGSR